MSRESKIRVGICLEYYIWLANAIHAVRLGSTDSKTIQSRNVNGIQAKYCRLCDIWWEFNAWNLVKICIANYKFSTIFLFYFIFYVFLKYAQLLNWGAFLQLVTLNDFINSFSGTWESFLWSPFLLSDDQGKPCHAYEGSIAFEAI